MYSVRPCTAGKIEFDLPKSMYSIRPIIQQTEESSNDESKLKDIEERQNALLEKMEYLLHQLSLYINVQKQIALDKATPIREALVVHLSVKQPSKNILSLIDKFHDKLSIRTYRHSSVRDKSFVSPISNAKPSNTQNDTRSLTVIWADDEQLPYMFHSKMKINDEQSIINLITHELTNKD